MEIKLVMEMEIKNQLVSQSANQQNKGGSMEKVMEVTQPVVLVPVFSQDELEARKKQKETIRLLMKEFYPTEYARIHSNSTVVNKTHRITPTGVSSTSLRQALKEYKAKFTWDLTKEDLFSYLTAYQQNNVSKIKELEAKGRAKVASYNKGNQQKFNDKETI